MTYNDDELKRLQAEWEAEAGVDLDEVEIPEAPVAPVDAVPMPIPDQARQMAEQFAAEQPTSEKAEQVRRNLLAVIALRDYLQFQGYVPDLAASDCWNPILRRLDDIADLVVSNVGRFECRAFAPGQEFCPLPGGVQYGRVGYVAVELDAELRWAWLLGFVPSVEADTKLRSNVVDRGDKRDTGDTGEKILSTNATSYENPVEGLRRSELLSMDEFGNHLRRLWLLQDILQHRDEQPWQPELREEIVALLERAYRTCRAVERTRYAEREIQQLTESEPETVGMDNRRSANSLGGSELRGFLREVFDDLDDALEAEE